MRSRRAPAQPETSDGMRDEGRMRMAVRRRSASVDWPEVTPDLYRVRDPDHRGWMFETDIRLARPVDVLVLLGRRETDDPELARALDDEFSDR